MARKIEAGTKSDQLLSGVDMLATFAALTGQTIEKKQLADSINLLPALIGNPEKALRDELILCPNKRSHMSIRKGEWLYINAKSSGGFGKGPGNHAAGGPACVEFVGDVNSDIVNGKIKKGAAPGQLYNLSTDLSQTTNLYHENPEVVKNMKKLLNSYKPTNKKRVK